ncbi:hypothetical protein N7535_000200 [Penicillium sp. DV-2018c]|nr:hypothetical protein N7535_000200 [Penicillium sp. DV-2018c]
MSPFEEELNIGPERSTVPSIPLLATTGEAYEDGMDDEQWFHHIATFDDTESRIRLNTVSRFAETLNGTRPYWVGCRQGLEAYITNLGSIAISAADLHMSRLKADLNNFQASPVVSLRQCFLAVRALARAQGTCRQYNPEVSKGQGVQTRDSSTREPRPQTSHNAILDKFYWGHDV